MDKTNYITPPKNCTGCGLCANVCAKNAIDMVWSKEGFLIPSVDTSACINCGACVKQCIALEEKAVYTDDIDSVIAYGGWNKDSGIHLQSSSGGIFTALAEHTLAAGGCVFGVVWKDKYTAVFDKCEDVASLSRMRGSKYTPAVPGKVYQQVRAELKTGRKVLFSGTPCQVHALKKFLRKPYDNLLTIDIVCHGAPSRLILEKYVQEGEQLSGKSIDYVSFRDKPEGWSRFHVTRHYVDGSSTSEALSTDLYMRLFLSDKALNHICYNCPYAHIPRQGDITLGDYWCVQKHHADWPIDKGISSILANTAQGKIALEQLQDKIDLRREPFKNIYEGQNVVYVRPEKQIPEDRSLILSKLTTCSLKKVYNLYLCGVSRGPFRISKNGLIYKLLIIPVRIVGKIKRIILKR